MSKHKRRTGQETVRASIVIDFATWVRWGAASAPRGMDRSEFAVIAIRSACEGVSVTGRSKIADRTRRGGHAGPAPSEGPGDAA